MEKALQGSYLKGEATPDSDIDIINEFKWGKRSAKMITVDQTIELLRGLQWKLPGNTR